MSDIRLTWCNCQLSSYEYFMPLSTRLLLCNRDTDQIHANPVRMKVPVGMKQIHRTSTWMDTDLVRLLFLYLSFVVCLELQTVNLFESILLNLNWYCQWTDSLLNLCTLPILLSWVLSLYSVSQWLLHSKCGWQQVFCRDCWVRMDVLWGYKQNLATMGVCGNRSHVDGYNNDMIIVIIILTRIMFMVLSSWPKSP